MRVIIFDAFGTLFRVTSGGSAKTIMKKISDCGMAVDEEAFLEEWKSYYKKHTLGDCEFMTERAIFIARIQMFYDRYHVNRNAENDADSLLAEAFQREVYPEVTNVLRELMKNYLVFIGSNTDNDTITDDILGPKEIGIKTVWIDRNGVGGNIGQDYTISDLRELISDVL